MKRRTFWKWSLGLSLTILPFAAARMQSAAEPATTATGEILAASVAAEDPTDRADSSAEEPDPPADTDAPAKLVSNEKTIPANIKPTGPVVEVIKLANSGLGEPVMLAFVTNSTRIFNLGAEEIIYLNDIGVPGSVVTAMIQRDQALKGSYAAAAAGPPAYSETPGTTVAPIDSSQLAVNGPAPDQAAPQPVETGQPYPVEAPLTPPDEGADEMFYDSLSPYGNWVDVEGYGRCWQPTVEVVNSGWQPYFDCGHWVYSDCGWYWLSDYSWGWAPFHYGCWFRHEHLGWCWVPGRTWGPSWVSWRYNDHFCGWAPLPPGASFVVGVGLTFHGRHMGERDDFGLRPGHYHFIAWDHFHDRQLRPSGLPSQQVARVYERSTVVTRISGDGHTVINNGLPLSRVAAATHRPIQTVALRDAAEPVSIGSRVERFEASSHTLAIYRPSPTTASRLPAREIGTGFQGGQRPSAGQSAPPAAAPSHGGSNRHSFNAPNTGQRPLAGQASPLIIRGPQSSALRESPSPNSLVVISRGTGSQAPPAAQPWNPSLSSTRPADAAAAMSPRSAPSVPAPNTVSRPEVNQNAQRSWTGTTSSSPKPAWFGRSDASAATRFNGTASVPRPETRSYYQAPARVAPEVPRYAPAPAYVPQRSYSPPAVSAPARTPSFESRPTPSAPSAPAASSSGSHSSSSSNRNSR